MADYIIQGQTLTDIADAIRAKTGGSAAMTPVEMPDEIASIQSGGEALNWLLDYIGGTLSGDVVFPAEVTQIKSAHPQGWNFYSNNAITAVTIPNTVEVFSTSRFQNLGNLTKVTISMSATSAPTDFFYSCSRLEIVEITEDCGLLSLSNYFFENLSALHTVIIRPNRLITMSASTSVRNCTNFGSGGTGKFYVPDSLVDNYKTATNWSSWASFINPLSDLPT